MKVKKPILSKLTKVSEPAVLRDAPVAEWGRVVTVRDAKTHLSALLEWVAAVVGVGFANVIASAILHKLTVSYQFHWLWTLAALLGTALLTVATGWFASYRVLGQKPLEVLREE